MEDLWKSIVEIFCAFWLWLEDLLSLPSPSKKTKKEKKNDKRRAPNM